MFSWFLKLLGIEEDKPVSSTNSFMANKPQKPTENKTAPQATKEPDRTDSPPKQTATDTLADKKAATEANTTAKEEPSAVAKEPSAVVKEPSAVVKEPSAVVKEPSAVVKEPSATTKSASSKEPVTKEASSTVKEPKKSKPKQAAKQTKSSTPADSKSKPDGLAKDFPGLKANHIKLLMSAGFSDKKSIDNAKDDELLAIKGIGQATLKVLRK